MSNAFNKKRKETEPFEGSASFQTNSWCGLQVESNELHPTSSVPRRLKRRVRVCVCVCVRECARVSVKEQ